jgi:hypothetical protein
MPHPVFDNTMFSGTKSKNSNTCCQVFATNFGWARARPLKQKVEAHEALLLLFKHDGVLPKMILEGSKEQVKEVFKPKLKEVNCHMRATKPYFPWQQAAKGCICKLKHGVSQKIIRTGAPKQHWDHCIKLEILICSYIAKNIYAMGGEVSETMMNRKTADISQLCEFIWYDWVMLCDTVNTINFLHDKSTHGVGTDGKDPETKCLLFDTVPLDARGDLM